MKITRVIKKQEDGSSEITMLLSEEQTGFLVNFALGLLIQQGTISFFDLDPNQPKGEAQETATFLEQLNPKDLPQA